MTNDKKVEEMSEKELIDYVNKGYADGKKLDEIAKEIGFKGKSGLSTKLNSLGYTYKNKKYIKVKKDNIIDLDLEYLLLGNFSSQLSARVDVKTKENFEKLCEDKYNAVPIAKLVSLALKEFTEKHK